MDSTAKPKVTIYTDGACSANGTARSRGGWAAILNRDGTDHSEELCGGEKPSTNQRMEIRAVIEGLKALGEPSEVTVYADSSYVINCMTKRWFDGWRRNGWLNSARKPVANRELWEELLAWVEDAGHSVEFKKVQGHADRPGRALTVHEQFNLRCDKLAVAAC
jgi:ribonuclease HI